MLVCDKPWIYCIAVGGDGGGRDYVDSQVNLRFHIFPRNRGTSDWVFGLLLGWIVTRYRKWNLSVFDDLCLSIKDIGSFASIILYELLFYFLTLFVYYLPYLKYHISRSSGKLLSFYKEIMAAQHFPFYIILSNYVWSTLFYQNKDHNVRQIKFHVCIKMHRCKRRVCKRKTLYGQPNVKSTS